MTSIYSLISYKNCVFLELHFLSGAAQSFGSMGCVTGYLPGRALGRELEFFHWPASLACSVIHNNNNLEQPSLDPCYLAIREKPLTVFALCHWITCVSFMKETLVAGVRQCRIHAHVSQLHTHRLPEFPSLL